MKGKEPDAGEDIRLIIQSLSREHRMLVILRDELYDQSWKNMHEDLNARLENRPYVFKLTSRIQDDLERINMLKKLEKTHRVNLGDYIKLDG